MQNTRDTQNAVQKTAKREQQATSAEMAFYLTLAIVFLMVLGVFMMLFSLTYIHDMETLVNVPDTVWGFVCGRPVESDVTLPLLLTLSTVAFVSSGVLFGVQRWILKRRDNAGV